MVSYLVARNILLQVLSFKIEGIIMKTTFLIIILSSLIGCVTDDSMSSFSIIGKWEVTKIVLQNPHNLETLDVTSALDVVETYEFNQDGNLYIERNGYEDLASAYEINGSAIVLDYNDRSELSSDIVLEDPTFKVIDDNYISIRILVYSSAYGDNLYGVRYLERSDE